MIRKAHIIILLAALFSLSCATRHALRIPTLYEEAWDDNQIEIARSKLADFEGESFGYQVRWRGLTVGRIEFNKLGLKDRLGENCHHIAIEARTTRAVSWLYPVKSKFDYYILDTELLRPYIIYADRKEGRKSEYSETLFDYQRQKIIRRCLEKGTVEEIELEEGVFGPMSLFYEFRTLDFSDQKYVFRVVERKKVWQVELNIEKKAILEIRDYGPTEAFLVRAQSYYEGEKAHAEIWVWFSADEKKIPLLIQVKHDNPLAGTVEALLE
jgi:hypothetical protein